MANPIAVPGTNVPSGAAVSPGGAQGPTVVSANANNKATLGSDSLILVQGTAAGVAATTHAQTVSGDDPQLTNARTPTAHAISHKSGGGDVIALDTLGATTDITTLNASTSAHGLLRKLDNTLTHYLDGTGAWSTPPAAVSTDAGNQSKLGSDSLIYTPGGVNGFITKTAAYTLTLADRNKYIICSGGSWTLTLPAPVVGLYFQLRNDMGISGTTGTITLQPTGGTIDGQSSIPLLPQQECTLITDGTNWRTFDLKREVILGTQDITTAQANGVILLPAGYRYFELEITGFSPVTAQDYLVTQLSSDGGSTWYTTNYYYGAVYNSTSTAVAFVQSTNTGNWEIGQSNYPSSGAHGELRMVFYPGSASTVPTFHTDGSNWTGSIVEKWLAGGFWNGTPVRMNALKYFGGLGGNFTSFLTVKAVV